MSASQGEDRSRLDGFELEIFKLISEGATFEQWTEWLRVPLEHSADSGDLGLLPRLMDAAVDGRAGWWRNRRILLGAVRLDGLEVDIFKLVAEGATSKQWKEWLRAPLEHAAAKGNMDLFTRLMDAGADGSAGWRGCRGRTLLGAAAYGQKEQMVLTLLLAGAEPDVNVKFGANRETALHVAAAYGSNPSCTHLLLSGADPNLLDIANYSPLHLAALAGHDGIIYKLLLKGARPDTKSSKSQLTPLHVAAFKGHASCVSALVRGGAYKDPRNGMGETPLHLAAQGNKVAAALELLAAGAAIDIGDTNKRSPLNVAALHGQVDVIRVLIKAGADVESKGLYDETPLQLAANRGDAGTMQELLEMGADVHARDWDGNTPLHLACAHICVDAVELLLRWGADEGATNDCGEDAEDTVKFFLNDSNDSDDDSDDDFDEFFDEEQYPEQCQTDGKRICEMLARAPADRSWRRRGWLVLARSIPAKVNFAINKGSGSDRSSAKEADTSGGDSEGSGSGGAGGHTIEIRRLLGWLICLEVENVFRSVVSFL